MAAVESSGVTLPASPSVTREKTVGNGKHCHQCRQHREIVAPCKNRRNNRQCFVRVCKKCLLNRYGEKVEEVATLEQWSCPKCRGICNCSVCMKKRGRQPTGILVSAVKATGFSSASEMLHQSADFTNNVKDSAEMTADLGKGVDFSSRKKGKENSFAGKLDANFQNLEENQKEIKHVQLDDTNDNNADKEIEKKTNNHVDGKKPKKPRREGLDENGDDDLYHQNAECLLPTGTDLTSVADIDMRAEDIGNALQFLEFCFVFEEIIDMRKGEAEYILEDVLRGKPVRRERSSLTVQFHIRLLSIIRSDHGETGVIRSWVDALKRCLSDSKYNSKDPVVVSLEKAPDYGALSATEKLRILNLLCDEVLWTDKARNWIKDQNSQFREKTKEAKQELRNAKMKDTTVSHSISVPAQAHAQSFELKGHQECDAMRIKPLFRDHRGCVYWKLNCNGKLDILHQNVGQGNTLTLDEKWFTLDNDGKEMVEKYVSSLRRK